MRAMLHELIAEHLDPTGEPDQVQVGIETERGPWVQALLAAGYRDAVAGGGVPGVRGAVWPGPGPAAVSGQGSSGVGAAGGAVVAETPSGLSSRCCARGGRSPRPATRSGRGLG